MSITWWMKEQHIAYPWSRILFSHKKEWNTDTKYNMGESWKHTKRTNTQKVTYYMILLTWNVQIKFYIDTEQISGLPGAGGGRVEGNC